MNQIAPISRKEEYRELNAVTGRVNAVIFGADVMEKLPVAELIHQFGLNISACNRSIEGLTVEEAFAELDTCVFQLHPGKVFLNFGDEELKNENCDLEAFVSDYAALIDTILEKQDCRIHIVSVVSASPRTDQVNALLRELAADLGCDFVDISDTMKQPRPLLSLFRTLSYHMREGRISFGEAMNIA